MKVNWSWLALALGALAFVSAVLLVVTMLSLRKTVAGMSDANECVLFHIAEHRRSTRLGREADSAHHGYYLDAEALEPSTVPIPLQASCATAYDD